MSVWKDPKKGTYVAKFWFQNKQYKKQGLPTIAAAKKWEADKLRELKTPLPFELPSISFAELATKYLEYCAAGRMQKNTWRAKRKYYRDFLLFLQEDPAADHLDRLKIEEFLQAIQRGDDTDNTPPDDPEYAPSKVTGGNKNANRYLKDLKALYNWGLARELIFKNPFRVITPLPEDPYEKYVPPPEDIDKVLMAADQEDMDMLICLYHTAGRIGEILKMRWEDVNFEKRLLVLWTRKRRGGAPEKNLMPMSDTLFSVLSRRWKIRDKSSPYIFCRADHEPYTYQQKRYLMRDLCAKANVKYFAYHAIRHHVASIIADSGKATLGQIQKYLRHKRPTTTETYLHELTRDQRELANILDERTGSRTGLMGTTEKQREVVSQ